MIGVTVLVAVAGGFVLWLRSYDEDPVDVDEVVERYRGSSQETSVVATAPTDGASSSSSAGPANTLEPVRGTGLPTAAVDPSTAPSPGVYVYATTGTEKVSALGGKTHHYPEETAATVTIEDGCVRARWDVLKQRWDENLLCPRDGVWELDELTTFHSFFRQDERREYTCEPGALHVPLEADPGSTFTGFCESPGSGHSGASTEDVTGEVMGTETMEVGGEAVEVVKLHYEIAIGGESQGAATVDRWFALDPVPLLVREEREGYTDSDTVIGNVHYEEQYEMQLRNMEPMR